MTQSDPIITGRDINFSSRFQITTHGDRNNSLRLDRFEQAQEFHCFSGPSRPKNSAFPSIMSSHSMDWILLA